MRLPTLFHQFQRLVQKSRDNPSRPPIDCARLENRVVFSGSPMEALSDIEFHGDPGDFDAGFELVEALQTEVAHPFNADPQDALSDLQEGNLLESGLPPRDQAKEVVFVDTGTENYQALLSEVLDSLSQRRIEIVLIDRQDDGIAEITRVLNGMHSLDAVHVVSHGSSGQIQLGEELLSRDTVSSHGGSIASWASALTSTGDILFYGCDLASQIIAAVSYTHLTLPTKA